MEGHNLFKCRGSLDEDQNTIEGQFVHCLSIFSCLLSYSSRSTLIYGSYGYDENNSSVEAGSSRISYLQVRGLPCRGLTLRQSPESRVKVRQSLPTCSTIWVSSVAVIHIDQLILECVARERQSKLQKICRQKSREESRNSLTQQVYRGTKTVHWKMVYHYQVEYTDGPKMRERILFLDKLVYYVATDRSSSTQ